jgi:hypothetical protein
VVTMVAALLVAVAVIGIALNEMYLSKRGAQRSNGEQSRSSQSRVLVRHPPPNGGGLSAEQIARLNAFRAKARFMAGETMESATWWRKIRYAWRDGYAGWIVASLLGAFSMATHFGAYWLILGGTWLGAIMVTLLSTLTLVAVCAWIGLGLVSTR